MLFRYTFSPFLRNELTSSHRCNILKKTYHFRRGGIFKWMLLGILVVGALGGVCMAALRNVSGDVGGGMGRDYMEKEWGITENKKE